MILVGSITEPADKRRITGPVKIGGDIFMLRRMGDTILVFTGYLIEIVNTRRHVKPVFFSDRAILDYIECTARRDGSQFLQLLVVE